MNVSIQSFFHKVPGSFNTQDSPALQASFGAEDFCPSDTSDTKFPEQKLKRLYFWRVTHMSELLV